MNSTEFKIVKVATDGEINYIMYKKHYFWFGLFWEWHLVVDTDDTIDISRYIMKNI